LWSGIIIDNRTAEFARVQSLKSPAALPRNVISVWFRRHHPAIAMLRTSLFRTGGVAE